MKINEDAKWISVGSIEDFVANQSEKVVDPYFDWFITSIVTNLKNYQLSNFTKSNISLLVYLLLNTQFQSTVRKIRESLDIPQNGFIDEKEYNSWRNGFYQAVNDYKGAKKIPLKLNRVITFTEKQIVKLSKGKWDIKVFLDNPEDIFSIVVVKRLNIGQDCNFKLWSNFIYHILFTFNPHGLLDNISKIDNERNELQIIKDDFFNTTSIVIPLNLDSSINSIKTILLNERGLIAENVKQLKKRSISTSIESFEIERDYALYKSYIPFKGTKRSNKGYGGSVRKQDHAFEQNEDKYHFESKKAKKDYEVNVIVKLISRIKKRSKIVFEDKSDSLSNIVTEIETTIPTPYPEYTNRR